jgi:DNA-binding XRE family transcriptional regulator
MTGPFIWMQIYGCGPGSTSPTRLTNHLFLCATLWYISLVGLLFWKEDRFLNNQEFSSFRQKLQKTQKELAALLGTSLKTVQSFEQGWRKVPVHVERQMLFLLKMKKGKEKEVRPCWEIRNCSVQTRQGCPAWEFNAGNLCWFINGTICFGKPQNSWSHKMKLCRKCEVFTNNFGTTGSRSDLK